MPPAMLRRVTQVLPAILLLLVPALVVGCGDHRPLAVREGWLARPGGDSLAYRVVGSGPDTVVFVHGGPAFGARYLEDAFEGLGDQRTLVFYDLRGRGHSPAVVTPDSLRLDVDVTDLEALRETLGLARLTLVGHHWGTAVVLKYALRYPGRVTRAALLAPFPHKGQYMFELIRQPHDTVALAAHLRAREARADTTDPPGYCRRFWGMALSPIEVTEPAVIGRLAPAICDAPPAALLAREGIQRQLFATFGTWDWSDSIPGLTMPVLVVTGAGSPALLAGARAWAGRLPDGRLLAAGVTPLFPWVQDGPGVLRALREFLAGTWPQASVPVPAPPDTATHP